MEAPGDCSPSRMVVSKTMTRSRFAASAGVVMAVNSLRGGGQVGCGCP
jgi:hypothetical protein